MSNMKHPDDGNNRRVMIRRLLETREARRFLGALIPEALHAYAGNSTFRKRIARFIEKHLLSGLAPATGSHSPEIGELLADEEFVAGTMTVLPEAVDRFLQMARSAATTIEGMETTKKKQLLNDIISRLVSGGSGPLITRGCRIVNAIHSEDPAFFSRALEPGFRKWVESIDFGEVREAVDNAAHDTRACAMMANSVLWEHPAKVILILSLIPALANRFMETAGISASRLNDLPADILADVVISFAREIETAPAVDLVNELTELARKIHTGSALIGDPGFPQLPKVLSAKIEEIVGRIDPALLYKARLAVAETGASISCAANNAANGQPELKRMSQRQKQEIANIRIRSLNHSLSWHDGLDDETTGEAASQTLSACDVQAMAGICNSMLRLFNAAADHDPALLPGFIGQFTSELDDDELAIAAGKLFGEPGESVPPAARAVVPQAVRWIAGVLAAADDTFEEEARLARASIRELFVPEKV